MDEWLNGILLIMSILSKDLLAAHDFANPETAILRPGALLADGAARLRLGTAAARHPYHGERARCRAAVRRKAGG